MLIVGQSAHGYCQVVVWDCTGCVGVTNIPTHMPRLKGFRYPRDVIAHAVWAYNRLALRTADVEDLLAWRLLSTHGQINLISRPRRYQLTATSYRHARSDAFSLWAEYTAEMGA